MHKHNVERDSYAQTYNTMHKMYNVTLSNKHTIYEGLQCETYE